MLKLVRPTLIAAVYARYSSDVQNDASIERQYADLEKNAPRFDLELRKPLYFEDRAKSATTLFNRPGLTRHLFSAAEQGLFDVVFVEHSDRLSRDPADMFTIRKELKFLKGPSGVLGIKIYSIHANGEVDELRATFEGYQNAQDSAKTSFRVYSGHNKAALDKKHICGPAAYGYEEVLGKPGEKTPIKSEAEIVNRIVREMAFRTSPRQIAIGLTADGIPTPKGEGAWSFQTINKILENQLYVGVYVRNKVKKVRNPKNGNRVNRPPSEEPLRIEMPDLRIVDQALWDAAQKVRQERANRQGGGKRCERATITRVIEPFMGLFTCADCGSKMIVAGRGRKVDDRQIKCSAAHLRNQCQHRKLYSLRRLSALSTEKMHAHLTDPDFVNERARQCAKRLAEMERDASVERVAVQQQLDRVDVRIKKVLRLIEDDDSDDLAEGRYKELRVEKRGLEQRIALIDASKPPPPLLPSAIDALARDVKTLHAMLKDQPYDPATRLALGNLLERVVVHPTEPNKPYDVSLYARHAAYSGTLPIFPHENNGLPMQIQSMPFYRHGLNLHQAGTNSGNAAVPLLSAFAQPILLGRFKEAA